VIRRLFEQAQPVILRRISREHGWGSLDSDVIHFEQRWTDVVTFITIDSPNLTMPVTFSPRPRRR
jgi:hypothetical protein